MVQILSEKGYGPESATSIDAVSGAEAPNLDSPGAPAFPQMRRVSGRKGLMRATSESDSDSADEGWCMVSPLSRTAGFPRLSRLTTVLDPENEEPRSTDLPIFKRPCCRSSRSFQADPACMPGDKKPATSSNTGAEVEEGDVRYIKTERVVLTQTFLTSWRVRSGWDVWECEYNQLSA